MPAPTKPFTSIPDASVDGDSPLDATLMTALRDNQQHLEEWIGHSFTAAQDHNHDGVNSAAIEVGPNYLRNGSFESDGTGWTTTAYTGGSIAFDTANDMDGAKCLAITSTVAANGGGDALSAAFVAITGGAQVAVKWSQKASGANIASSVQVLWYDDAQGSISTTTLYSTANSGTTAARRARVATAPTTARYCKLKLIGGVPAGGSGTGTMYFDGVSLTEPQGHLVLLAEVTASASATLDIAEGFDSTAFDEYELHLTRLAPATNAVDCWLRISTDAGSTYKAGASDYIYALTGLSNNGSAATASSAGTTQVLLSAASALGSANADRGFSGVVRIARPDTTDNCTGRWHAHYGGINPVAAIVQGTFSVADFNAAVNGLRVMMSSGNVASGTARLYGVRKGV